MDPIHTLSELKEVFNKRMAAFESQLQKNPDASSSSTGLVAEFAEFKKFVTQALRTLQSQVEVLANATDAMEMRNRRGILLLHGVAEVKDEDTATVVAKTVQAKLGLETFKVSDIKRCHRMGQSASASKTRPILFKLRDVDMRNKIWFCKTKLKGSGVTLSEFLTKARHDLFMAARKKFGVHKCWTRDGTVYALGSNGSRHRILSYADIDGIQVQQQVASAAPEKPINARPKRTASATAHKK